MEANDANDDGDPGLDQQLALASKAMRIACLEGACDVEDARFAIVSEGECGVLSVFAILEDTNWVTVAVADSHGGSAGVTVYSCAIEALRDACNRVLARLAMKEEKESGGS